MNKRLIVLIFLFFLLLLSTVPLYSQEGESVTVGEVEEEPEESVDAMSGAESSKGNVHIFLNSLLIFPLSVYDGGFGLGETITFQYRFPQKINIGIETGYYGFKSVADAGGFPVVGGYSIVPVMAQVSYDFRIVENVFVTPVFKLGFGYTAAELNGWLGDSSFSSMFEGGVRLKGILSGGLLIQGNIMYTGLIEKSGIFSIMSLGFGFGL